MKISSFFIALVLLLSGVGCSSQPFAAGTTKTDRPYPDGVWVGPRNIEEFERELYAEKAAVSAARREGKLIQTTEVFPSIKQWEHLNKVIQPGDQLWQFYPSPHAVYGGPRYIGVSIIRNGVTVESIVTKVID